MTEADSVAKAICAHRLAAAALELEQATRNGDLTNVDALAETIGERLAELDAVLAAGMRGRTLALAS